MNYGALKWLVETVVQNYVCPECNANVNDINIDVIWAAGNTVNIDIECPSCGKHSMIKSEVISFDMTKMMIPKEHLDNIQANIEIIKGKQLKHQKELAIKDEIIVDLNRDLKKKNFNASDLFGDEK